MPETCKNCGGHTNIPYTWNSTVQPVMCTCPKEVSLAWECSRCHRINSPYTKSCDCTPSSVSGAPTCSPQPNKHLIDEAGHWNFHGPHYNPYWCKTPTIINKDNEV